MQLTNEEVAIIINLINLAPVTGKDAEVVVYIKQKLGNLNAAEKADTKKDEKPVEENKTPEETTK